MKHQRTSVLRVIKSNELDTDKALIADMMRFIDARLNDPDKAMSVKEAVKAVRLTIRAKNSINGRK